MIVDRLRRLLGRRRYVPPELEAYRRLAAKGFRPDAIIDVGAYEGNWTRLARTAFPGVPVLMVEAQAAKEAVLRDVVREHPGVMLEMAVLGREAGRSVTFYEMETGSSFMPENSNVARTAREMQTRTLDAVMTLPGDNLFLKIDVQGAELEVLAGGQDMLRRCAVVQLETALLPYNEGAPTIFETFSAMRDWGFVPFDISGMTRPTGDDLVQIDVVFVPTDSPLRTRFFEF